LRNRSWGRGMTWGRASYGQHEQSQTIEVMDAHGQRGAMDGSNKTGVSRLRRRCWHDSSLRPRSHATTAVQDAQDNTQRTCYEFTYKVTRPVGDLAVGLFGRSEEKKKAGMNAKPPSPLPTADDATDAVGERTAEMVAEVLEQTRALATRVNSEERRLAHANARLDYMLVTSWLGDILLFALLGLAVWAGS
jgi:hypothetical protein